MRRLNLLSEAAAFAVEHPVGLVGEVRLSELPPEFQSVPLHNSGEFWMFCGGAVLILSAIAAAVWFRWQYPPCRDEEDRLWRNLCRVHGLTAFQRDVLAWVTRRADLTHPACLLLTRQEFDRAIHAAKLPRWLARIHRRRFALIAQKVFAE